MRFQTSFSKYCVSVLLCSLPFACLSACTAGKDPNPLPSVDEIKTVNAQFYSSQLGKQIEFDVPKEHWQGLFSALLPAKKDNDPAKWESLGKLSMTLNDGKPFHVSLYATSNGPGAFAAGPSFKERVYYRGGETAKLQEALSAAWKKTQEKSHDTR